MKNKIFKYFTNQIVKDNQILVSILGICSALAVTTTVTTALIMGVSVSLVTAFSSFILSSIRNYTPDNIRMLTQLIIISTLVIIVDLFLKAFFFDTSKTLSVFVGLIITNCIVMGRAESVAKNTPPIPSFLDGLGAGCGYCLVLIIISTIRELFGFGSFCGFQVVPKYIYKMGYQNIGLMSLAPSAFFIIGLLIWILQIKKNK